MYNTRNNNGLNVIQNMSNHYVYDMEISYYFHNKNFRVEKHILSNTIKTINTIWNPCSYPKKIYNKLHTKNTLSNNKFKLLLM